MARCCRAARRAEGAGGRAIEEAFLCGLLHDVGKIVLAEGCPGEYTRILLLAQARNVPLADVEADELMLKNQRIPAEKSLAIRGAFHLGLCFFCIRAVFSA